MYCVSVTFLRMRVDISWINREREYKAVGSHLRLMFLGKYKHLWVSSWFRVEWHNDSLCLSLSLFTFLSPPSYLPFLSSSFASTYSSFRSSSYRKNNPLAFSSISTHTCKHLCMHIFSYACTHFPKLPWKERKKKLHNIHADINVSIYPNTFYLIVSIKARPFQNNMRKRNIHKDGINGE